MSKYSIDIMKFKVNLKTLGNELGALQNWFQKYLLGSHSFVSALTDGETFWSGLAIFVVSNYTVIVWVIIDLILILSARNISLSSAQLNNEIDLSLDMDSHACTKNGRGHEIETKKKLLSRFIYIYFRCYLRQDNH